MQRRTFIRGTAFTAGLLTLSANQMLAAFFNDPAWKIKMLSDEIGIFTERGEQSLSIYPKMELWL